MRKYFQITSVLTIFGLLVVFRQLHGGDERPVVGKNQALNTPIQSITSTPTPSRTSQQATGPNVSQVTVAPTQTPTPSPSGMYKDGTFTGSVADAFYGNIQVQAVVSGGRLTDVVFLQYPNDNPTSQYVNSQALPYLKQEALQAQSANVDLISGASASSQAFQQSLADALAQAK